MSVALCQDATLKQPTLLWIGTGPTSCGHPAVDTSGALVPCLDADAQFPVSFNATETGFSSTRRNLFRGPNYFNSDFDLLKRFNITERANFAVGANFYNVFNHPNFATPNADVNNIFAAPFGTSSATGGSAHLYLRVSRVGDCPIGSGFKPER